MKGFAMLWRRKLNSLGARGLGWVLVRGFNSRYHNKETTLLNIDPDGANLN